MTRKHKTISKHKIDEERRTVLRRDTCPRFISYGLGGLKCFDEFFGFFWTKRCRLNEGIFVHLCSKKACARHVGSLPSLQTAQLDGKGWIVNFCNFLGCN
jgi:hypothetical protein